MTEFTSNSTNQAPSKALDTVDNLILGWLVRNGNIKTFSKMPSSIAYQDDNSPSLTQRSKLLALVQSGNITESIATISPILCDMKPTKKYSQGQIYFLLLAQQFIELVRIGNFAAAFKWAQDFMVPISEQDQNCLPILNEVLGLLAYQEPLTSPIKYLLNKSRYPWLADLLNQSLLKTPDSALEALLKQVLAVDALIEEEDGFEDEVDAKKWANLQHLLTGTTLTVKAPQKPSILPPKLKLLKND